MTVGELVALLQGIEDQDRPVFVEDDCARSGWSELTYVTEIGDNLHLEGSGDSE